MFDKILWGYKFKSESDVEKEHYTFLKSFYGKSFLDAFTTTDLDEGRLRLGYDAAYRIKYFSSLMHNYKGEGYNLFVQYKCSHPFKNSNAEGYELWAPDKVPFMRFKIHNDDEQNQLTDLLSISANFGNREQVFYCTNSINQPVLYVRNTDTKKYQKLFFYLPVSANLRNHKYCSHHPASQDIYLHSEIEKSRKRGFEVLKRREDLRMSVTESLIKVRNSIADFKDIDSRVNVEKIEDMALSYRNSYVAESRSEEKYALDAIKMMLYQSFLKSNYGLSWSLSF